MGHSRMCEYQANMVFADNPSIERIGGCQNVKEAKKWVTINQAKEYGQADCIEVRLWPQTAKAKRFVSGRGDYIVVTKDKVVFEKVC